MNGKIKFALIFSAVLIISGIVSFITIIALTGKSDKIFSGVTFKGVNLGGRNRAEAVRTVDEYVSSLREKTVLTRFKGETGSFSLADIDLAANSDSIVDMAVQAGRQGNFLEQWQERKKMAAQGKEIPFKFSVSRDRLKAVLEDMTAGIRIPAKDARLVITAEDTAEIIESSGGTEVDIDDAHSQIQELIGNEQALELELRFVETEPETTTEDIKELQINGLLAEFTTVFNPSNENRTENIRVAAAALDGQMIKPDEEFSFNKIVGPRSQDAGYKVALTILNNEFIDGLGGGVCQVSSTLYNVLLRADLEIKERYNHSLVIGYVPIGQDAAVVYGAKDLKFKNNLPGALIIKTSMTRSTITIKLFGDSSLRNKVKIVNNITKEYPYKTVYKEDNTLEKGLEVEKQKGVNGYRVDSRMDVYREGTLIGTRQLPPSYYKPLDRIVSVGIKPVAGTPDTGDQIGAGEQTETGTGQDSSPGTTEPGGQSPVTNPVQPPVQPPVSPPDDQPSTPGDDGVQQPGPEQQPI